MANSLLEHETVETEEVLAILADKPWPPPNVTIPTSNEEPPLAASTPSEPEPRERPKRLPTISPEPA
jgi:hypothetical protein